MIDAATFDRLAAGKGPAWVSALLELTLATAAQDRAWDRFDRTGQKRDRAAWSKAWARMEAASLALRDLEAREAFA